ncbi:hypothetical protein PYCCODRAFT_377648 [Trametes coccinea BRFM310]|uniref:Uncharacterized protein n=1 Tax=Trametes coccinea (strain BRFM310) TaxID=1353009 RepID=A0A1Y2J3M0_TRAC3|nr:hypothetical protein PYCCODRAFT_377648 [Trametes coccinea BRFM310]
MSYRIYLAELSLGQSSSLSSVEADVHTAVFLSPIRCAGSRVPWMSSFRSSLAPSFRLARNTRQPGSLRWRCIWAWLLRASLITLLSCGGRRRARPRSTVRCLCMSSRSLRDSGCVTVRPRTRNLAHMGGAAALAAMCVAARLTGLEKQRSSSRSY